MAWTTLRLQLPLNKSLTQALCTFFVGIDEFDLEAVSQITGFDYDDYDPQSIIQFLQLPTVTARVSIKQKDLIVDYTKAIVLSSPQYVEVTVHIKTYKENTTKEKASQRELREETKRRKAAESEVDIAERATEHDEVGCQKKLL